MTPGEVFILVMVILEFGLILALSVHFAKRLERLEGRRSRKRGEVK